MFSISSNIAEVEASMQRVMSQQLPFALSRAINDTADSVIEAEQVEMSRVFDAPTPFTMNALMARKSSKDNLVAEVRTKDTVGRRHYLSVETEGGPRGAKAFETLIARRAGVSMHIAAVLPADAARIDQYGNWSMGQINQVLSGLGAHRDGAANTTKASAKRAKPRGRGSYFVPRNGGLSPGVFHRDASGVLHHIATFVSAAPVYTPIFKFDEVAQSTANRVMPGHLARRLSEALATAR